MSDSPTVIRRYIDEVWIGRDVQAADDLVAEDFVRHGPAWEGGDTRGREAFKEALTGFFAIFPDLHQEILRHKMRIRTSGTHTGASFMGVEPTGTEVAFPCLWMIRASNGKVTEEWVSYDSLYVMTQLGVVSLPAAA